MGGRSADPWAALDAELDAWRAAGRTATLWWRDDDARRPGPALARLLELAAARQVPLALAVIPAGAEDALAGCLGGRVSVLQHGEAHRNHAGPGEKKQELGPHRRPRAVLAGLALGRARLAALAGPAALPVLVPPWNRIAATLVPQLAAAGYRGLSTFGPRAAAMPAPGLRQANTHLDPVAWHGGRRFAGTGAALAQALAHLRARRTGAADAAEPSGLLTHHRDHDAAGWAFIEAFLARTCAHPAVRWLDAREIFAPGAAISGGR